MSEMKKTLSFAGGALLLAALAAATAPRAPRPDAFSDLGEPFFPDFQDPNAAASLEVVSFDEESGSAEAFKVVNEGGLWTIPSHHNYPADGKDRLAKTAAGVMGLRKDDFRSANTADHEALGVIDPLDETATSLKGRGQRVTLRGGGGEVLADFIVGGQPEGRTGFRFVRVPGQKRVYGVKLDVDLSTRFEDWIEKDLLLVTRADIDRVTIKDYSVDEYTGRLNQRDVVRLRLDGSTWEADRMSASQKVDVTKMSTLIGALDNLQIVGVRPKPAGLSANLARTAAAPLTQSDMMSLQSRGFYFTRDGQLVSNEGEMQAYTKDGVEYTLRFGELAYGQGETLTAGTGGAEEPAEGAGENRYLFITADFDESALPEPPAPGPASFEGKDAADWTDADRAAKQRHDDHEAWEKKVEAAREKVQTLNARFAGWYYVIPADAFDKLHLTRRDLVVAAS